MDFVHDQLFDGRAFRILTAVDQLSRGSPLIEIDFSLSRQKLAGALERESRNRVWEWTVRGEADDSV